MLFDNDSGVGSITIRMVLSPFGLSSQTVCHRINCGGRNSGAIDCALSGQLTSMGWAGILLHAV